MGDRRTLVHRVGEHAVRCPSQPALVGRVAGDPRNVASGEWRQLSWAVFWTSVRQAARGLEHHGVVEGQVVPMLGRSRPDQVVAQWGVVLAGGVPAPLDGGMTDAELAARLRGLQTRLVVCDGLPCLQRLLGLAAREGLELASVVILDAVTTHDARLLTFDDLMMDGALVPDHAIERRLSELGGESPALLLVGPEEHRRVTHQALLDAGEGLVAHLALDAQREHRLVAPLAPHTLEGQVANLVLPLLMGGSVWFAQGPDVVATVADAHPTVLIGEASTWEVLTEALLERVGRDGGLRSQIARWLLDVGERPSSPAESPARERRRSLPPGLSRSVARRLTLDELREVGLAELVAAVSTAPLRPSTRERLRMLELDVREWGASAEE